MTGEAFFIFLCFRGVLRLGRDRVVLGRARCSEHEVARELLRNARRAALRAREPDSALGVGFSSAWL